MADWLRPVFARAKTPIPITTSNIDRHIICLSQDATETESALPPRPKVASRVSSYINLRASMPTMPKGSESSFDFREPRDPETIYHKPSRDQIAEMVKVVMMNQSSTAPIPVQYNSCILHVLEAYQEMSGELSRKEEIIEDLKQAHANDIRNIDILSKQWKEREKDYELELKNLEVLLSKTDGGLEKVSLARTRSTIHGSTKAYNSIGNMIATIKKRNSKQISMEQGKNFDPESVLVLIKDRPMQPPRS